MFQRILTVLVCFALCGCSEIEEALLPINAKFNKSFPPNAEVRVAEEGLRALLVQDKAKTKAFDDYYASRLELRALTCAQGLSINRFDRLNAVRSLPVKRDCLSAQDTQLLQYLGTKQVGIRLAQPPLRPLSPLGPPTSIPNPSGVEIFSGVGASDAGVALLRGIRGEFISIEIPSGKKIAALPPQPEAGNRIILSPNGRVGVIQGRSGGVMFFDLETGAKLWENREINQFLAWLPESSAALTSDAKSSALSIIDFDAGTVDPHPLGMRGQTWALSAGKSPSRTLLGSGREFSLLEHSRTAEGIQASKVKSFRISDGQGVTSTPPTLVVDGKAIVFVSVRDFMLVDLDSGQETIWRTGEFLANRYAKLDETTLLVDSYTTGKGGSKSWLFDIVQATLAPIEPEAGPTGYLSDLDGRTGFMRRSSGQVWVGDALKAGDPISLESLLSTFNMERQLAKLDAESRSSEASSGRSFYGSSAPAPAPDFRPAPAAPAWNSTPSTKTVSSNSLIEPLARDAQIEGVGVYQGTTSADQPTTGGRKAGKVEVRVRRSAKPIVLVLSSYEPVRWMLTLEPGATLAAVLVSGYYQSEVVGAGSARVVTTGDRYAYKLDTPEFASLNRETMRWTGKGITVFQGRYEGTSFSVGG